MREPRIDRPHMPGYGVPQEPGEGMLPWSWVCERMHSARSYWIAVVRPDGRPRVTPVWAVWMDDTLYFGVGQRSQKALSLAADPHLVVHLESGDEVVILEGQVERIHQPEVFAALEPLYGEKYGYYPFQGKGEPQNDDPWYAVRVEKALAWVENDFLRTATRWTW